MPEQGWTDAVILLIEGACIGKVLDLTEHFDPNSPMLGEVIFGAPAIFEAQTRSLALWTNLVGKERIESDQKLLAGELDDGTELQNIRFAIRGLLIFKQKRHGGSVTFAID